MITIKDWIATIPEEDRHLAYMGEHQTVMRQFLLTGEGWRDYADWGFHLDMAFDLSSVTTRDTRQMENTKVESSETVSDTLVKTTANTKKEKYTVSDVMVDCHSETDIASLTKELTDVGLVLTWTVLRQHTQLPGRLWANIRALGPDGQVKKSAVMVFDVGASVGAEAAADLPQSEFEAMEQNMDEMLDAVLKNAQMVEFHTAQAREHADDANGFAQQAEEAVILAQNISLDVKNQVDGIRDEMSQVANTSATLETTVTGVRNELEDLRTAYTGSVYESAGEAVRSQTGAAMMEIGLLDGRVTELEEGVLTVDSALDGHSTNPIQNKVVTTSINAINTRYSQLNTQVSKLPTIEAKLNQLWTTTFNYINAHP
ncbi:MAG: hypothetical protein IIX28_03855 [Clostridia bacterium]|nr:hypothetical protein [Clostridia bacterium]